MTQPILASLLAGEALLFAAACSVHAGVTLRGFEHGRAATAEGVIATALILGLVVGLLRPARARPAAMAAQGFALLGTLVGVFTIAIGVGPQTTPDRVFHVVMLALLAAGLAAVRTSPSASGDELSYPTRRSTDMKPKNTICLWFNMDALDAARFYAATFPDSTVTAVRKAPSDFPAGKAGDVLTVEFTLLGIPCLGLNGGPTFTHTEAFSFQVATEDQEETDRYWNAIVGNGGAESVCGWCKDRWGISWQIIPRVLGDALAAGGDQATRAFDAMMKMKKIDVAAIEAARRA